MGKSEAAKLVGSNGESLMTDRCQLETLLGWELKQEASVFLHVAFPTELLESVLKESNPSRQDGSSNALCGLIVEFIHHHFHHILLIMQDQP